MIYEHQQTHDPPLGTLWGLPETPTLPYLVMSYIKEDSIAKEDHLTHNPSKTI